MDETKEMLKQLPMETHGLLVQMMQQNLRDSHFTTNTLIDNLTRENKELKARLKIIIEDIQTAFDSPYMPNPNYIESLLFPSREKVLRAIPGDDDV